MANPLVLLLAVPLIIAVVNLTLPVLLRKLTTFAGLVFCLLLVYGLFNRTPDSVELLGINIASLDRLTLLALTFIQALSFIILVFSLKGVDGRIEKPFFVLYPLTVSFSNGAVMSDHALSFLLFWGLSGLMLYWFALLGRGEGAPSTAKKTFVLVGGSDAFLIMGLAVMALKAGWTLNGAAIPLKDGASIVAFILLLIAAFAKSGGFPLHTWVPDFGKDAPVESAAFLPASLDKILGIYLLTRMMSSYFDVGLVMSLVVVTFGALTVITAVMMAMAQHNGRRLLGYHAVSQVGYMIMGVGSGSAVAFAGGIFHLINNTIYKSNLFLSLGSVEKRAGTNELDDLGGLGRLMPVTFIMALVGSLSISGIPPFNGFFSKWMIYQGLLEKAAGLSPGFQIWLLICLILAVFGSALTLASFMKFLHSIFLGKRPARLDGIKEAPPNQLLATGSLALFCVLFGLFARELPLRLFILPAAQASGRETGAMSGLYNPQLILTLFGLAFLTGFILFLLTKKVRYDDLYLGGQSPSELFRVVGTEFYKEIVNLRPLKAVYGWAQKKYFDIYEVGGKATFGFSHLLRRAHSGQLQVYALFIVLGLLVFILLGR